MRGAERVHEVSALPLRGVGFPVKPRCGAAAFARVRVGSRFQSGEPPGDGGDAVAKTETDGGSWRGMQLSWAQPNPSFKCVCVCVRKRAGGLVWYQSPRLEGRGLPRPFWAGGS